MTSATIAMIYAALAALPAAMHVALACGAPLGRFTVGGRFAGRLPPLWRALAVVQALLLAGMALVVLECGGAIASRVPQDLLWPVVGVSVLTFLANAASPSAPERRLWTPVTFGMVASVLTVTLL